MDIKVPHPRFAAGLPIGWRDLDGALSKLQTLFFTKRACGIQDHQIGLTKPTSLKAWGLSLKINKASCQRHSALTKVLLRATKQQTKQRSKTFITATGKHVCVGATAFISRWRCADGAKSLFSLKSTGRPLTAAFVAIAATAAAWITFDINRRAKEVLI